jgi:hypothetical protein
MGRVILDSRVLLGLLDPDDALHTSAREAVSSKRRDGYELAIPASVLSECLVRAHLWPYAWPARQAWTPAGRPAAMEANHGAAHARQADLQRADSTLHSARSEACRATVL